MKISSLLLSLLVLVNVIVSIRVRHGVRGRLASHSKCSLLNMMTLTSRSHSKIGVKFFNLNKMKVINIQFGKVFWNTTQMPDLKPNYPKMVKNLYKFQGRNCYDN